MLNILEMFKTLSILDVVYAAVCALMLTNLIMFISRRAKIISITKIEADDVEEARKLCIKKYMEWFPLDTINFRGKVFTKGMMVRITTLRKKIIVGEIIGRNDKNILCVIAGEHIIAHALDKIEDITEVDVSQKTTNIL